MIRIEGVQLFGISKIHQIHDRVLRYITIVCDGGIVQFSVEPWRIVGDKPSDLFKRLEVTVEAEPVEHPAAPKHDEGDGA